MNTLSNLSIYSRQDSTVSTFLISDFGDDDIETLVDHFRPILNNAEVDIGAIDSEWTNLKVEMYKGYV